MGGDVTRAILRMRLLVRMLSGWHPPGGGVMVERKMQEERAETSKSRQGDGCTQWKIHHYLLYSTPDQKNLCHFPRRLATRYC